MIINFLYNPFFKARLDGSPVELTRNQFDQMALFVPEGSHKIEVTYSDPNLVVGFYIAIGFLAGCLVFLFVQANIFTGGIR